MGDFEVKRATTISAPPERIQGLIEDFREWRRWSPWEEVDPDLRRDYAGADSGVGARYAWEGNRKAGKGSMEILESGPQRVHVKLNFEKPWKASNDVDFTLDTAGANTEVTWRMWGHQKGMAAVFAKIFPMDRMVGRDMEKGLARMKSAAEAGGSAPQSP